MKAESLWRFSFSYWRPRNRNSLFDRSAAFVQLGSSAQWMGFCFPFVALVGLDWPTLVPFLENRMKHRSKWNRLDCNALQANFRWDEQETRNRKVQSKSFELIISISCMKQWDNFCICSFSLWPHTVQCLCTWIICKHFNYLDAQVYLEVRVEQGKAFPRWSRFCVHQMWTANTENYVVCWCVLLRVITGRLCVSLLVF